MLLKHKETRRNARRVKGKTHAQMIKKIPVAVSLEFLLGVHGSGAGRDRQMNLSISGKRLAGGLIWPIGRVVYLLFGRLVRIRVFG